ncbi:hypothetical protein BC835DRAFT_1307575 [Cytidiella melzeri]|nr:hypothetical protein BC835DRAFT_1307575 [Cytidiella melzeri]
MSRQSVTGMPRNCQPPEAGVNPATGPPSSEHRQPPAKRPQIEPSVVSEPAGRTLTSERRASVHTSQPSLHNRGFTQPPHGGFRNPFTPSETTRTPSETLHTSTAESQTPLSSRCSLSGPSLTHGTSGLGISRAISNSMAAMNDLLQGLQATSGSQDELLKDARRRLNDMDGFLTTVNEKMKEMHAFVMEQDERLTVQEEQIRMQDEQIETHNEQISTLDNVLAHLQGQFVELHAALNNAGVATDRGGEQGVPVPRGAGSGVLGPVGKKERNPLINGVVRAAVRKLMGIETLHAPVPDPLEDGSFWTTDDPAAKDRCLRPRWDSWVVNADAWQAEFIDTLRDRGHRWYSNGNHDPETLQEYLKTVPEAEIAAALSTVWTGLKVKYQGQNKDEITKQLTLQKNCRRTRKDAKFKECAKERNKYQSSDYSDVEEESEGGIFSENDDGPPAKKVSHIFVRHCPTYRDALVNNLVDELDEHVRAAQNTSRDHRRVKLGEPVERNLPKRHGQQTQNQVISEECVDLDWLMAHPQQNVPNRVRPAAGSVQSANEGARSAAGDADSIAQATHPSAQDSSAGPPESGVGAERDADSIAQATHPSAQDSSAGPPESGVGAERGENGGGGESPFGDADYA